MVADDWAIAFQFQHRRAEYSDWRHRDPRVQL